MIFLLWLGIITIFLIIVRDCLLEFILKRYKSMPIWFGIYMVQSLLALWTLIILVVNYKQTEYFRNAMQFFGSN